MYWWWGEVTTTPPTGRSSKTVCTLNLGLLPYNGLGTGVVGVGLSQNHKRHPK